MNVQIPIRDTRLAGDLVIPGEALGIVVFAHGSGSSRYSPRNRLVASALQRASLATLLMDLLTEEEEAVDLQTTELRFNIDLLARRLMAAVNWVADQPSLEDLRIGCFGASTGAAAALIAAAETPNDIAAVVSRGGRPDLADAALAGVQAPTLLIVGSEDAVVAGLNRDALAQLQCEKRLEIIAGATHLFEEPGALEKVARLARLWFERYLGQRLNQTSAA